MNHKWIILPASLLILIGLPQTGHTNVTLADPVQVGSDGQLLELGSTDNAVMRIPISADAAGDTLTSIEIINDYWGSGDVADQPDLSAVKLWYMANDTAAKLNTTTATYVATLSYNAARSAPAWNDLSVSQFVENNSALYVTVDIAPTAVVTRECSFTSRASWITFQSAGNFPASELPSPPAVQVITSFFPASPLEISHQKKGQINLSTGQSFTPLTFTFDNVGSTATATAPIWLTGITVTVRDQSDTIIAPDLALSKLGVFGTSIAGPVFAEVISIPSTAVPVYIPFSTTITVSNDLSLDLFGNVTANTTTAAASFKLEISNGSSIEANDALSLRTVAVQPALMETYPIQSNLLTIRYAATEVQMYHTPILSSTDAVLKGQQNIEPMGFTFINPGTTNTSQADITHFTLTLTDGSNNPLVPSNVFSRISIKGGGVTYGELTSLPTSGNQMLLTLSSSFISAPVYQPVTATVSVDILPTANAVEFKLTLSNAAAINAQDGNSLLSIPVNAAYASDLFPMSSAVIPIASSFLITGQNLAPGTIYPGQRRTMLELTISHPGPTNIGNLILHALTITVQDLNDQVVVPSDDLDALIVSDQAGQIIGLTNPTPNTLSTYINLSSNVVLAPFASATIRIELLAKSSFTNKLLRLSLVSNADVEVSQPSDPTREVFVAGTWPIQSDLVSLGGGEGKLRLSNFPNPFSAGREDTTIAYFLENSSNVTAKLFTLIGDEVVALSKNEFQSAGEQTLIWNGRNATGSAVVNGVYLLRIEAVPVSSGEKIIQIRKIAVVK